MSKPLLQSYNVGDTVNFSVERIGRICRASGEKVAVCPVCKGRGMRMNLLNGKVRYVHIATIGEINIIPVEACTMWPRTEFELKYGYDGIHPKYRRPGDEDATVEKIRQ